MVVIQTDSYFGLRLIAYFFHGSLYGLKIVGTFHNIPKSDLRNWALH